MMTRMTKPLSRTPRPPSLWQQCWQQPPHSSRPTTAPPTRMQTTTARQTCTQTTTVPTIPTSTMVVPIVLLPPRTQTNGAPRDKSLQHRLSENPLESCPEYKYTLFLQILEFWSSKYKPGTFSRWQKSILPNRRNNQTVLKFEELALCNYKFSIGDLGQ